MDMKRTTTIVAASVLVVAASAYLVLGAAGPAPAQAQGANVRITGRLGCMSCALAHPDQPCTAACLKAGGPPALTDARGGTYLLLTREKGTPLMTPARLQMMGSQVTVQGLLVGRSGLQAIYVDAMEKAEARQVTVTGHLSCTFCTLARPGMMCSPTCCLDCVKGGDPPSLTDDEGEMYLLLSSEKETPLMTATRLELMGGEATVKGLLVNRNGVRAIYVDSMQK
jgi:hypothetical protein